MEKTTKTPVIDPEEIVKDAYCSQQEEAPVMGNPEDPQAEIKKQIMENLSKLHIMSFNKFLSIKYPEGVDKIEHLDTQFEAFAYGFNSGIYQAAGEILFMVGVNLNEMKSNSEIQQMMAEGLKNSCDCQKEKSEETKRNPKPKRQLKRTREND